MSTASLTLDFAAAPADAEVQAVYAAVREFNHARSGIPHGRGFAFFLRDGGGAMQAAVCCRLWGNSVHVDALWVDATLRGQGHGARLMQAAEAHARHEGARLAYVETLSFQARPFYEGLGYTVFGELPEIADGVMLYFLRKPLAGDARGMPSRHASPDRGQP